MSPVKPTWASWFVWISESKQEGFLLDLLGFGTQFEAREWIRIMLEKYAGDNFDVDGGMETGFRIHDRVLDVVRVVHNGQTLPLLERTCPVVRTGHVPGPMLCAAPLHHTEQEENAPVMDKRFPNLYSADFTGRRLVMVLPHGF